LAQKVVQPIKYTLKIPRPASIAISRLRGFDGLYKVGKDIMGVEGQLDGFFTRFLADCLRKVLGEFLLQTWLTA
jgi:hypothetical protein